MDDLAPLAQIDIDDAPAKAAGRDRFADRMVDFWCENVRRFGEGEPLLGAVDRLAGY